MFDAEMRESDDLFVAAGPVRRGKTRKPQFGWRLRGSRYEPVEREFKWVRKIFDLRAQGLRYEQIVWELRAQNFVGRRGGTAHLSLVERVLRNPDNQRVLARRRRDYIASEIETLRNQIEALRRPWWRRLLGV